MKGYTYTKVWEIDRKLVVAPTIEEAIALYKTYMGKEYHDEPKNIWAVGSSDCVCRNYDAIIKDNEQ